ncbi:tautomerase family protein [Rhodococcus opacus]|uniref:Putative tautomerase n=1 Tax=Rhodococcus opacus (strain B4) TaxID=632772 RepID=C1B6S4_RHOOB|nr:tautomerase family protein [Rhodococcus opacus]BAH51377.1 putative tautomerase [Rhodococcus opacus B4]
MPNITVEIFRGRTLDQRRQFVQGITQAAVDAFDISPEGVRITFFEIDRHDLARGGRLFGDPAPAAVDAAASQPADPSAVGQR